MKFVQIHKLVALRLCLGVLRTGVQNLRPRLLQPGCIGDGGSCAKKQDCCKGLNCVGTLSNDGSKTCEKPGARTKNHCIPEDKQCNNGERPHDCCEGFCALQEGGKHKCAPCLPSGGEGCAAHGDCCGNLFCDNQECVSCLPLNVKGCIVDDDCCNGYFCSNALRCVVCLSAYDSCNAHDECCRGLWRDYGRCFYRR